MLADGPYDALMTRVLLAEDDYAISEPLARALRREGYEVDVRVDGAAALEGAKENPDLVVLDLGLPCIDGLAPVWGWPWLATWRRPTAVGSS
jgi:DNA-binding response OmpR family regulator